MNEQYFPTYMFATVHTLSHCRDLSFSSLLFLYSAFKNFVCLFHVRFHFWHVCIQKKKKKLILSDRICDVSRFPFSLSETFLRPNTHTHSHMPCDKFHFVSFWPHILMHLSFAVMCSVFTFIHLCLSSVIQDFDCEYIEWQLYV